MKVLYVVIRRVVIGLLVPLAGTGREDKGPRRHHVRLVIVRNVPSVPMPTLPRLENPATWRTRVRLRLPERALDCHRASMTDVGDIAQLLHRAHGDDVLGRGRRQNRVGIAAAAIVVAAAVIARRKHKQHRLRTGYFRQRVAHRRVVTGRRQIIGIVAAVVPTVVGYQRVGLRRRFLKSWSESVSNPCASKFASGAMPRNWPLVRRHDGTGRVGHRH